MFLGVSGRLLRMDITDDQRAKLGQLVGELRAQEYGTKSGAYRAAQLNPTTWDRIENGLKVREDRLRAAVRTLWPSSRGDWRWVLQSPDERTPDPLAEFTGEKERPPIKRAPEPSMEAWTRKIEMQVEDLEDRMAELEQRVGGTPRSGQAVTVTDEVVSPEPSEDRDD